MIEQLSHKAVALFVLSFVLVIDCKINVQNKQINTDARLKKSADSRQVFAIKTASLISCRICGQLLLLSGTVKADTIEIRKRGDQLISLTNRQLDILSFLLKQQDFINIQSVAKKFKVSERTIRYDLDFIQGFLKEIDIGLVRKPRKGVCLKLSTEEKARLESKLVLLDNTIATKEENILLISFEMLIRDKTTLDELSDRLELSKSTVYHLMAETEMFFKRTGIMLVKKPSHGLSIDGNELDIRNCFSLLYSDAASSTLLRKYVKQLFPSDVTKNADVFIGLYEEETKTYFSDHAREELLMSICFQFNRIKKGQLVQYPFMERKGILETQESSLINRLYKSVFCVSLHVDELSYLTKQIKGTKVTSCLTQVFDLNEDIQNESFYRITHDFINEVKLLIGIDFSKDLEFVNGLMIHLQVALHRLKNNQKIENSLTEQVKFKYRYIYEITRKSLLPIEKKYHLYFPDEEVAYIAMHLGASYERYSFSGFMPTALIVCGSGLATSSLLATRMKVMLPEIKTVGPVNTNNYKNYLDESIDFIVATVPIESDRKVLRVNPLLDSEDIAKLQAETFKKAYQKQVLALTKHESMKNDDLEMAMIIPEEHIQLNKSIDEWRKAIKLASKPLLDNQYISDEYVDDMIRAVEELGPYMVFIPEVAVVHASPKKGVLRDGISLLQLSDAIKFGDSGQVMVKVIFVICSMEAESSLFLKLIQIIERSTNQEKIKNAQNKKDILLSHI